MVIPKGEKAAITAIEMVKTVRRKGCKVCMSMAVRESGCWAGASGNAAQIILNWAIRLEA